MIFVLLISIVIIGIAVYFLGPKDFWESDLVDLTISRAGLAFFISFCFLGLSFLNFFYWSDPLSDSVIKKVIEIISWIPMFIPFLIGFTEGDEYVLLVVIVELLLMTLVVRSFIPVRWVIKLRGKLKGSPNKKLGKS